MPQVILDADRLAKLDNAAGYLGSTREEVLNQAIDKFTDCLADSYDQWLARKVAKSIKTADDGKLVPLSEVDSWCEEMIASFASGKARWVWKSYGLRMQGTTSERYFTISQ